MNKLSDIYNKVKKHRFANKYLIVTTLFIIFIAFFDENSIYKRFKVKYENRNLKEEIETYKEKLTTDSLSLKTLKTDRNSIEQFAREEYNIKKENEDVYIIKEEE